MCPRDLSKQKPHPYLVSTMEDVKEQVLMTEDTREDIKENGEDDHNKGREEKLDAAIGFQQNDPSNVASCSPSSSR